MAIRLRLEAAAKSGGGTTFFHVNPTSCEMSRVPAWGRSQIIPPTEASCHKGTLDTTLLAAWVLNIAFMVLVSEVQVLPPSKECPMLPDWPMPTKPEMNHMSLGDNT